MFTGLDPAGPLYTLTEDKDKLSEGDAQFVQIIHTDAGGLGTSEESGDADYWPNGGGIQPGCLLSFRCMLTANNFKSDIIITY